MEGSSQNRVNWTSEEEDRIFALHREFGNKWTTIATHLKSRHENCIKNKFYSTLRKGLRKMNKYIAEVRRRRNRVDLTNNKLLKADLVTKLTAIADNNYDEKYEVKAKALEIAQGLQLKIIELARGPREFDVIENETYEEQQNLLQQILTFKKHCKRRKGKRRSLNEGSVTHKVLVKQEALDSEQLPSNSENERISKSYKEAELDENRVQVQKNQTIRSIIFEAPKAGFRPQRERPQAKEVLDNSMRFSINIEEGLPFLLNRSSSTPSQVSGAFSARHFFDSSVIFNPFTNVTGNLMNQFGPQTPRSWFTDSQNMNRDGNPFLIEHMSFLQPPRNYHFLLDSSNISRNEEMPPINNELINKRLSSSEVLGGSAEDKQQPMISRSDSIHPLSHSQLFNDNKEAKQSLTNKALQLEE